MVAVNRKPAETWLFFFQKDFQLVGEKISIKNKWSEGSGILKDELGHVPSGPNGTVSLRMVTPVGNRAKPETWDLYYTAVELERTKESLTIKIHPTGSNILMGF